MLDSLLERLEKHSRTLEDQVEEKTAECKQEKDRVNELLYQMLPKEVAEDLKVGKVRMKKI